MLLVPALVGLSFLSETLRRAPLVGFAHLLRTAACMFAFVPLASAIMVGVKVSATRGKGPPRVGLLWLPVVAGAVCVPIFVGLLHGVENQVSRARRHEEFLAIQSLRASVAGGNIERACELVASDPKVNASEMAACRRSVDGQRDLSARLKRLEGFVGDNHFKSWDSRELGQTSKYDPGRSYPAVPYEDQKWFLNSYFNGLSVQNDFLSTDSSRERFRTLVQDVFYLTWSSEARGEFQAQIKPKLIKAVGKARSSTTTNSMLSNDALITLLNSNRDRGQ